MAEKETTHISIDLNELGKAGKYFLNKLKTNEGYTLIDTKDTPFFHHVVLVQILQKAINNDELFQELEKGEKTI